MESRAPGDANQFHTQFFIVVDIALWTVQIASMKCQNPSTTLRGTPKKGRYDSSLGLMKAVVIVILWFKYANFLATPWHMAAT
jgi:hypothetical protein